MRLPISNLFALALILLVLQACATVPAPQSQFRETDNLETVVSDALDMAAQYGKNDVLVVFDIDNTLLAMEQGLGSDQWYDWQKELQAEDRCSSLLVTNRLAVQGALYFASAMRLTQPDAASLVEQLQSAGLKVIALTSRGADFRLQTFRELRRNGISLWSSALPPQHGYAESFVPEGGARPALYEDGVFMTAGQHKGDMLQALLVKTGTPTPKVVIFTDDKENNLYDVLATYEGSATSIHAWRYSREDAAVADFDGVYASELWDALRPALQTIQQLMGPDNFDLPPQVAAEGCPGM